MDLAQRITSLLDREHTALREAIAEAEAALADLEAGKREWTEPERKITTTPAPYRHGERPPPPRHGTPVPAPRRPNRSTTGLRAAWNLLSARLEGHLRRKRDLVLPLCLRIARGDLQHRSAVRTTLTQMSGEHEELRSLLTDVRREARSVPPVRNEMERVGRLLEAHVRIEETEIYPAVFGEELLPAGATPVPADARTAGDVARSLRARRPDEPEPLPEPPPTVVERFLRMFRK